MTFTLAQPGVNPGAFGGDSMGFEDILMGFFGDFVGFDDILMGFHGD